MNDPPILRGLRRDLTREIFEDLAALQCEPPEILGYIGTTPEKLEKWCRKTYRKPLEDMLRMIRQDGLIAIRRASFEQLKKSATIITQQYNRFLPQAGSGDRSSADDAIRAFTGMVNTPEETVRELFE
ncbi:MAG: hypothetical protein K6E17_08950 [Clostridiales bacterium]|nr:hypothetical protein [Clostridiales bacterium]